MTHKKEELRDLINGIQFNLSPMSDNFVDIILSSLDKVDTSHVWSNTDKVSTLYRGTRKAVWDAVRAVYVQSYKEGVHTSIHMTFSKGCPGDGCDNYKLDVEKEDVNNEESRKIDFDLAGKFSLYPMGSGDYMDLIYDVIEEGKKRDVTREGGDYATKLKGNVHDVFDYLEYVAERSNEDVDHYIMEITLAHNFPEGE